MGESWLSVGIDVGTTTTSMILSRLTAKNRAGPYAVPELEITGRELLYESPVRFTPLLGGERVDGDAIAGIIQEEYAAAGVRREQVATGAIIITGETSRKENAEAVLRSLSGFAGEFVAATAGPDLESILAARGAGAVAYSEKTAAPVLHMDIGGGTSNLALAENGRITATACLNIGGRLLKFDKNRRVIYLSPVLRGLIPVKEGDTLTKEQAESVARLLCGILEQAACVAPKGELFGHFCTREAAAPPPHIPENTVFSFSGGVADCIRRETEWDCYGDLGPLLGSAIARSALCRGAYRLGEQTIRATVIGAGCHSARLSGSTVFVRDTPLPLKDLAAVCLTEAEQDSPRLGELIRERLAGQEQPVLALPGWVSPSYEKLTRLADTLVSAVSGPVRVALRWDMAKALGHALALRTDAPILCLDKIPLREGDYLDVADIKAEAYPVVIKTLILSRNS